MTFPAKTSKTRTALHIANSMVMNQSIRDGKVPSCLNCKEFQNDGQCGKYKMTPPAEVIVYSCDDWDFDIPF